MGRYHPKLLILVGKSALGAGKATICVGKKIDNWDLTNVQKETEPNPWSEAASLLDHVKQPRRRWSSS